MDNYEMIVKSVEFTADEIDLIKNALEYSQERAVSRVEELTIEGLLDKLDS